MSTSKKTKTKKKPIGRPPMKGIRRCITIPDEADAVFLRLGAGCRSLGIREAARLLKDVKPTNLGDV